MFQKSSNENETSNFLPSRMSFLQVITKLRRCYLPIISIFEIDSYERFPLLRERKLLPIPWRQIHIIAVFTKLKTILLNFRSYPFLISLFLLLHMSLGSKKGFRVVAFENLYLWLHYPFLWAFLLHTYQAPQIYRKSTSMTSRLHITNFTCALYLYFHDFTWNVTLHYALLVKLQECHLETELVEFLSSNIIKSRDAEHFLSSLKMVNFWTVRSLQLNFTTLWDRFCSFLPGFLCCFLNFTSALR